MSAKLILPLLSLSVFYAIFYFADVNGLRALAKQHIATKTLPGTNAALRTVYVGVEPLDELLTMLTTFFWPVADGTHPGLLLHSIGFSGAFLGAWVLVTLESWRKASAGKIIAFPFIFGLAAQVLTFAFAAPLYAAFQVFTSRTARNPTAENIRVPNSILKLIPLAFVIGNAVPSALMLVPLSERVTPDLKQIFIAIWQPWPAYVAIILSTVYVVLGSGDDDTADGIRKSRRSLRHVYAFAFANTAITHLITVGTALGTVVAPFIFQKGFVESLHPFRVFDTPFPWTSPVVQVTTIGQGVHGFLRWDYIIGTTGVLVWALSLYRSAHKAAYGKVDGVDLFVKTALLAALAGPVGAAIELVWERDELVFAQPAKGKVLQKKK